MAQEKVYRARRELRLDCEDVVRPGEEFVVEKRFVCIKHASASASKSDAPQRKPEQASQK